MVAEILIGARFLQYAGAFVLFGTSAFYLYGTRVPVRPVELQQGSAERPLMRVAAGAGLLGAVVWLMAETVVMSGAASDATNPSALWAIVSETRFGLACSVRILLLLLSLGVCFVVNRPQVLWWFLLLLGGAVSLSFAWTGHGALEINKTAGFHLAGDLLHLLAAGIWIGALVPLAAMGFRATRFATIEDAQELRFALTKFSSIGVWVVSVLVLSGVINSVFLIDFGHWRTSLSSPYARVLVVKLALFGAMLGLAALNRYRTPLATALKAVKARLVIETLLAVLVLGAASILGTLEPPVGDNF